MKRKEEINRDCQSDNNIKPAWSETDQKKLRQLIRKHGVDVVCRMASETVPRSPGRPSRGPLPHFERMHLADWIQEQRAEHERMGHSAALKRAINDAYEMLYGDDPDRPDPEKFAKTLKRKLYPALRNLEEQKEAAERINAICRNERAQKNSA